MKGKTVVVSAQIPISMRERIKNLALNSGLWLNESDFIRDIIREKLDNLEAIRDSEVNKT